MSSKEKRTFLTQTPPAAALGLMVLAMVVVGLAVVSLAVVVALVVLAMLVGVTGLH